MAGTGILLNLPNWLQNAMVFIAILLLLFSLWANRSKILFAFGCDDRIHVDWIDMIWQIVSCHACGCTGEWTRCVTRALCGCNKDLHGRNVMKDLGVYYGLVGQPVRIKNIVAGDMISPPLRGNFYIQIEIGQYPPQNSTVMENAKSDFVSLPGEHVLLLKDNLSDNNVRFLIRDMKTLGSTDICDVYISPKKLLMWAKATSESEKATRLGRSHFLDMWEFFQPCVKFCQTCVKFCQPCVDLWTCIDLCFCCLRRLHRDYEPLKFDPVRIRMEPVNRRQQVLSPPWIMFELSKEPDEPTTGHLVDDCWPCTGGTNTGAPGFLEIKIKESKSAMKSVRTTGTVTGGIIQLVPLYDSTGRNADGVTQADGSRPQAEQNLEDQRALNRLRSWKASANTVCLWLSLIIILFLLLHIFQSVCFSKYEKIRVLRNLKFEFPVNESGHEEVVRCGMTKYEAELDDTLRMPLEDLMHSYRLFSFAWGIRAMPERFSNGTRYQDWRDVPMMQRRCFDLDGERREYLTDDCAGHNFFSEDCCCPDATMIQDTCADLRDRNNTDLIGQLPPKAFLTILGDSAPMCQGPQWLFSLGFGYPGCVLVGSCANKWFALIGGAMYVLAGVTSCAWCCFSCGISREEEKVWAGFDALMQDRE